MSCRTLREVAEKAGVPERTLYSWLHEDTAFKQAYKELRQRQLQQISDSVSDKVTEALEVLSEVMGDSEERGSARVNAARITLDTYVKILQLTELEERLAAIEEQLLRR